MRKKLGWSVRMSLSNELPPLEFQNNYEEKCFNHFIRIRYHYDCRLRYAICSRDIKVFYYYQDDELFDINKDIDILRQFMKNVNLTNLVGTRQLKSELIILSTIITVT